MKRIFLVLSSLVLAAPVLAAPQARFLNRGVITNAIPIDAVIFENRGIFTNILTSEFPYEMSNVRYFTNASGATMQGSSGFRFETILDTFGPSPRRPLTSFFNGNNATITATDSGIALSAFGGIFLGTSSGTASRVEVSATNLVSHGNISVGNVGLLQLSGNNVDLSRSSVIAGDLSVSDTNLDEFLFGSFDLNSYGVEDIYGGAGDQTINLDPTVFSFNSLGYDPEGFGVYSPLHDVQLRSGPGGLGGIGFFLNASVSLPQTFPSDFEAHTYITERPTAKGIDKEIQVVFVKTNFADASLTANVRFGPSDVTVNPFAQTAVVEFSTPEFDPITGLIITNAVYFIDSSAEFGGIFAITNFFANSSVRPSSYRIRFSPPYSWVFGEPANTDYDPSLIYPGDSYEDKVVDANYGGYAAKIGRNPESVTGLGGFTNLFNFTFGNNLTNLDELILFPDPTNQPGRVEIDADTLDLTLARVRAEGLLSINAKHLTGGGAFDVSAGIINADIGSTNGFLVVSNVFPNHFKRVRGDIYAYSAIWNNTETNDFETNDNSFHVLILDHNLRAEFTPTVRSLTLRATNLVVKDNLTINRQARFFAEDLTFGGTTASGSNTVITVTEDAVNIDSSNFVGVKNFLNETNSTFQGANALTLGFDDDEGFDSIINRGTISATAPYFKATSFENSGTIIATNGGSIAIEADTADISRGTNIADNGIYITADNLLAANSTITAGFIDLNVDNFISDFGPGANNVWQVRDGFSLQQKPSEGDLLGTEIRTVADGFRQVQHIWAGQDVGPGSGGYFNNVALGHLIMDIQSTNAALHFGGPDFNDSYALYVVNLDFNVGPSVDINANLNSLLKIDDNFRIYYINSNAGDKLTNAFPDRVMQVESFAFDNGLAPLSVSANGFGIVTPNLDGKVLKIGDEYQVKAKAGRGQVFKGWSGGTNSSSSSLTFKMRRHLALRANFIPNPFDDSSNPVQGNYNGLFSETNGVQHESSGFFNLKLTKNGVFTGKILSGKTYPFRGAFDGVGHAQISVHRARQSDLHLDLYVDLANHTDQVTGTVSDGNWTANLVADRAGAAPAPVVESGKHTMVISGGELPGPVGDGFGTINVDPNGSLNLKGTLADGTQIHQKVNVSKDGRWPFYSALYHGTGSLFSWVTFTNDVLAGDLAWFKKPVPGRNYQNGFTNLTTVIGSRYVASEPVLGIGNGIVTLNGGNLSAAITNEFTLSSNNVVTVTTGTNQLSIRISLPSGQLNGTFVHPDTQKTTVLKGVVLQQQNNARGFFLDADKSGAVNLE